MKKKHYQDELDLESVDFCTECRDELNSFGVYPKIMDLKIILENFENCRRIGKFKGDICAKLYIAQKRLYLNPADEE